MCARLGENMMLPVRKVVRLQPWNYAAVGYYFVTVCTYQRRFLFGDVRSGEMHLSNLGKLADLELDISLSIRSEFALDCVIIMPNHLHMVLVRSEEGAAENELEYKRSAREPRSLSTFMGGYKAGVTTARNSLRQTPGEPVWQRGFNEHIIRSEEALNRIREYIFNNPLKWHLDRFNPNRMAGARDEIDSIIKGDQSIPISH